MKQAHCYVSVTCLYGVYCYCYMFIVKCSGKYIPPHQRGSGRLQSSDSWADSDSGSSSRGGPQGKFFCSFLGYFILKHSDYARDVN